MEETQTSFTFTCYSLDCYWDAETWQSWLSVKDGVRKKKGWVFEAKALQGMTMKKLRANRL